MKFSLDRLFQGILCAAFIFGFAQVAWGQTETAKEIYHFRDMHTHPWFWEVMASALVGWILGMVKGFSGTKDWLEKYWNRPPTVLVFLGDFLVFVFVGAYFGTAIYNPDKFMEALAAGLTWPIAVGAMSTKVEQVQGRMKQIEREKKIPLLWRTIVKFGLAALLAVAFLLDRLEVKPGPWSGGILIGVAAVGLFFAFYFVYYRNK